MAPRGKNGEAQKEYKPQKKCFVGFKICSGTNTASGEFFEEWELKKVVFEIIWENAGHVRNGRITIPHQKIK